MKNKLAYRFTIKKIHNFIYNKSKIFKAYLCVTF